MGTYLLRGIDKVFWRKVKRYANNNGLSVKDLIFMSLETFIKGEESEKKNV